MDIGLSLLAREAGLPPSLCERNAEALGRFAGLIAGEAYKAVMRVHSERQNQPEAAAALDEAMRAIHQRFVGAEGV